MPNLLVLSVRRRAPTAEQMAIIRQYIEAGKPLVGIRTACHAFDTRGKAPPGHVEWKIVRSRRARRPLHRPYPNELTAVDRSAHLTSRTHPILAGVSTPFRSLRLALQDQPAGGLGRPSLMGRPAPTSRSRSHGSIGRARRASSTRRWGIPAISISPSSAGCSRTPSSGHSTGQPASAMRKPEHTTAARSAGTRCRAENRPPFDRGQGPLSPSAALASFKVPGDLQLDLVLAEPVVRQPVSISFDERGRLWVVQYLQYPFPAGLKMVSHDGVWRAVYDKVPPPPPHHFRGKDKITIHEDTDGDGVFDRHKTFLDGLNIVTALAQGRGGVWVLNPPYLLFYPDRNNDDVPDGDPEVHLQGFGLEDTHSVVNSLRWGPDGWLYAAQGSTVTGHVTRPGLDAGKEPVTRWDN